MTEQSFPILADLRADGPYPGRGEQLAVFGQFVGAWEIDSAYYDVAGQCTYRGRWEWSFAWILGGLAIQDVIVEVTGQQRIPFGSTVRYCDPASGRWTVYWLGARAGNTVQLHGGLDGADIVLEGPDPDGTQNRWTFSDITDSAFTWTGLESNDGVSWRRTQLMHAQRRA